MSLLAKDALILFVVITTAVVVVRYLLNKKGASQKSKTITTFLIIGVPIFLVTLWAFFPGFPYSV